MAAFARTAFGDSDSYFFSGQRGHGELLTPRQWVPAPRWVARSALKVNIFRYSTDADRQVLVQAFASGQQQGLVKALEKMKPAGRIAITGTLGYDLAYIRLIKTPTGRTIRFATNRRFDFAEADPTPKPGLRSSPAGEFESE